MNADSVTQGWEGTLAVRRLITGVVALVTMMLVCGLGAWAQAKSYSVVYSFQCGGGDGQNPWSDLISDSAGNLYGTTRGGGTFGDGTVFEISVGGAEAVLYSFGATPGDGSGPVTGLVRDNAGNLYGTTPGGGAHTVGALYEVSPDGQETMLVSFNDPVGAYPYGELLRDSAGDLYGTATSGGTSGEGTVYRLVPNGKLSAIYSFAGPPGDGAGPSGGLIRDSAGHLYGVTSGGGADNLGTVFELSKPGADTVLYSFAGGSETDGSDPSAGLVGDAAGNLYGITVEGGSGEECTPRGGCGTVFKLTPSGQETILYGFSYGSEGAYPYGGLVIDPKGNLYGVTSQGGSSAGECLTEAGALACGVVFEVTASGEYKVLHSFTGPPADGEAPYGGLLLMSGALYGTTSEGGSGGDCGTVYKLVP
jgi:uncharacterized repeat protein (TIGR03803 family)